MSLGAAARNDTIDLALDGSRVFPNPMLSANLYGHAALDELVAYAIVPFRDALRAQDLSDVFFWLLRYGKGGEHLKIRIHGPSEWREQLRHLLERSVEAAWAQMPPSSVDRPLGWRGAPPVDEEDTAAEDHPDRTLIWTRYRRSPVSLGEGGLLENDRYITLVTGCLAAGCDRVLDVFQDHAFPTPASKKQKALIAIFIEALAIVDWPVDLRRRYLAYHRDSLFRFLLAGSAEPEEGALKLGARCEENLAKVQDPDNTLAERLRESWERPPGSTTAWQQAIAGLHRWISDPREFSRRIDPFAWDRRFTPMFKVLHGVSNQLGMNHLNEGFLCHLLLAMTGADERPPVSFYPDCRWAES